MDCRCHQRHSSANYSSDTCAHGDARRDRGTDRYAQSDSRANHGSNYSTNGSTYRHSNCGPHYRAYGNASCRKLCRTELDCCGL